jgi:GT2 family glycosyltransferase
MTSCREVDKLASCLKRLDERIGYAVVVNQYSLGDPIDALQGDADLFIRLPSNMGYGSAINKAARRIRSRWIAAVNTDISWSPGCFESLAGWLSDRQDVAMAVPKIVNESGEVQMLCKKDPSILAMASRRFIPAWLKPRQLTKYDLDYICASEDYDDIFDVEYLSGCCMIINRNLFEKIGGFDERFFLYLEDADLTRALREYGRCIHLPIASVVHFWGRGNYKSKRLAFVNIMSAIRYFGKWGITLY